MLDRFLIFIAGPPEQFIRPPLQVLMDTSSHDIVSEMSAAPRRWVARGCLLLLALYWLALITATHIPKVQDPLKFQNSDKVVHFTAYAVLAFLASLALAVHGRWNRHIAIRLVVVLLILGVLDEVTQPYFGRHADVADWGADALGVLVGVTVFGAAWRQVRRRLLAG